MESSPGRTLDALIAAIESRKEDPEPHAAALASALEAFEALCRQEAREGEEPPEEPPSRRLLDGILSHRLRARWPQEALPLAVLEWLDPGDALFLVAAALQGHRVAAWRPPRVRGECPQTLDGPCPHVLCKYHLWTDPDRLNKDKILLHGGGLNASLTCTFDAVDVIQNQRPRPTVEGRRDWGELAVIEMGAGISRETIRKSVMESQATLREILEDLGEDGVLPPVQTDEHMYPEDLEADGPLDGSLEGLGPALAPPSSEGYNQGGTVEEDPSGRQPSECQSGRVRRRGSTGTRRRVVDERRRSPR